MTAEEATMRAWLAGDSEPHRIHAAYRLTLPFDTGPDGSAGPAPRDALADDLAAVNACPHRGPTLPHSQQPEATGCGCGSAELTECRAGRGPPARPGAVSLAECLECVRLTPGPTGGQDVKNS